MTYVRITLFFILTKVKVSEYYRSGRLLVAIPEGGVIMHSEPTGSFRRLGPAILVKRGKAISFRWALRTVHMTMGLIGALLIMLMSVTGLLLNHKSLIGYSTSTEFKLQELIFSVHSGSLGNTKIVWLTDLAAICMLTLSITGIWIWIDTMWRKFKRRHVR
jgi:hypothetical protein